MNLVWTYYLVLYEFSVAQVDRAPALSGTQIFFFVPSSWHADHFIFIKRIYVARKWLKPSEVFSFKGKMNFAALLFFLSAGNIIKNSSGQMRQLYGYDTNESTRRLVEDGISPAFTNRRTTRGFSVVYHVFSWKQCILCSALRHKSYLTLRDSFCLGSTFGHVFIRPSTRGCELVDKNCKIKSVHMQGRRKKNERFCSF